MTPHPAPSRRGRATRLSHRALPAAALILSASLLTGCSQLAGEAEPAPVAVPTTSPVAEQVEPAAQQTPVATPSTNPQNNSDLRYVSSTASPCSMVWSAGSLLPRDYEWCLDETGEPVAGVRIGSCEVVAFRNQMYAVPGRAIVAGNGTLQNDPQFLAALTSCKRRPASAS